MKLEAHLVVAELAAGQSGPFDRVLAFLDVLLRFTSLIVESNHSLGGPCASVGSFFSVRRSGPGRGLENIVAPTPLVLEWAVMGGHLGNPVSREVSS